MNYENVLTKLEIKELSFIKTTYEQARQIKDRNIVLLDFLRSKKPYLKEIFNETFDEEVTLCTPIGCPHCECHDSCDTCEWNVPHLREIEQEELPPLNGAFCVYQTFGGIQIKLRTLFITYRPSSADVSLDLFPPITSFSRFEKVYLDSETLLLGHIQWADIVLFEKA